MFEELDYQETPNGVISLRRRAEPRLNGRVLYEVKLNEEWLMSSLFTEAEIQLAHLGLSLTRKSIPTNLKVVVGGLGLGYTAAAALENSAVSQLCVIDIMQPVIDWHQNHLVPLGEALTSDSRCTLTHGDFFAMATREKPGFSIKMDYPVDAILLDIDHSPSHWLNVKNKSFYSAASLIKMASKLAPGGVFGLWSNDPPDADFQTLLDSIFDTTETHDVHFSNPYTNGKSSNTVYLAALSN
jgi:spermidine synthase